MRSRIFLSEAAKKLLAKKESKTKKPANASGSTADTSAKKGGKPNG